MRCALILGGAESVIAEAEAARQLGRFDAVLAINDMIAAWPDRIDYAVTLHPEKLGAWLADRVRLGRNCDFETWAHSFRGPHGVAVPGPDRVCADWGGSSGLFAAKVAAIELGFGRVVVAGVPMTAEAGHFVRREKWTDCAAFRGAWLHRKGALIGAVRSMSGWTKELLGAPTQAWLAGA